MSIMKIVLTGPESTGKSTLAAQLAKHYKCEWVPEFARQFIDELDRPYQQADLLAIARGQLELEKKVIEKGKNLIICDTDLLTIKIWSEYKYGTCDPWIIDQIYQQFTDWYFLCGIDIPWVPDPQREHPEKRAELMMIYEKELRDLEAGFMILNGDAEQRRQKAIDQIDALIAGLTYNRFF